jgi:hypothetical protein
MCLELHAMSASFAIMNRRMNLKCMVQTNAYTILRRLLSKGSRKTVAIQIESANGFQCLQKSSDSDRKQDLKRARFYMKERFGGSEFI